MSISFEKGTKTFKVAVRVNGRIKTVGRFATHAMAVRAEQQVDVAKSRVIMCVPDLHLPAEHPDAFAFLKAVKLRFNPDVVVNTGDEVDAHALGRYPKDPDTLSAGHELKVVIKKLKILYKIFPRMSLCIGNHTARAYKQAFFAGLPKAYLKDFNDVFKAPKMWVWADRHIIDGILFEHGESVSGKMGHLTAAEKNRMSTVIGHIHSHAGINFSTGRKDTIWGMNIGCLVDENHPYMAYAKNMRNRSTLGCGIIAKGIPFFVPMVVDDNNKWIGVI